MSSSPRRGAPSDDEEVFHDAEEGFQDEPLPTACGPPGRPAGPSGSEVPTLQGNPALSGGRSGERAASGDGAGRVWGSMGAADAGAGNAGRSAWTRMDAILGTPARARQDAGSPPPAWAQPNPPTSPRAAAPGLSAPRAAAEAWEMGWDDRDIFPREDAPTPPRDAPWATLPARRSRPGSREAQRRPADPFAGSAFDPLSASIFEPFPERDDRWRATAGAFALSAAYGAAPERAEAAPTPVPTLLDPLLAPMPDPFFPDPLADSIFAARPGRGGAAEREGLAEPLELPPGPFSAPAPEPLRPAPGPASEPLRPAPGPASEPLRPASDSDSDIFQPLALPPPAPASEFPLAVPSPPASPPPLPPVGALPDERDDPWHRAALETRAHVIGRLLRLIAIMSDLEGEMPSEDFWHARRAVLLILGVIRAVDVRHWLREPEWAPLSGRRPARRGASRRPPIALIPKDVTPPAEESARGKHAGRSERKRDEGKKRPPKGNRA